jgi:hypothetical protein
MAGRPRQSVTGLASFQFGMTSILFPPRTALGAFHLASKPGDQRVARIAGHAENNLVSARVIQAAGDQGVHALLPHIGEVHRRAGWVALVHRSHSWGG